MTNEELERISKAGYDKLKETVGGIHVLPWEDLPPIAQNAYRNITKLVEEEVVGRECQQCNGVGYLSYFDKDKEVNDYLLTQVDDEGKPLHRIPRYSSPCTCINGRVGGQWAVIGPWNDIQKRMDGLEKYR